MHSLHFLRFAFFINALGYFGIGAYLIYLSVTYQITGYGFLPLFALPGALVMFAMALACYIWTFTSDEAPEEFTWPTLDNNHE